MGFYKKNEYLRQAGQTRRAMSETAMNAARSVSNEYNKVAESIAQGLNSVGRVAAQAYQDDIDAKAAAAAELKKMQNIRQGLKALGATQQIQDAVNADGMTSDVAQALVSLATNKDNVIQESFNQGINRRTTNTLTGETHTLGDTKLMLDNRGKGGSGNTKKWSDFNNQSLLNTDSELANFLLENEYVKLENGVYKTHDYEATNKAIASFKASKIPKGQTDKTKTQTSFNIPKNASIDDLQKQFPNLTKEQIQFAIQEGDKWGQKTKKFFGLK